MKDFIEGLTVGAKVNITLRDAAACIVVNFHRQVKAVHERNFQKDNLKMTEGIQVHCD